MNSAKIMTSSTNKDKQSKLCTYNVVKYKLGDRLRINELLVIICVIIASIIFVLE